MNIFIKQFVFTKCTITFIINHGEAYIFLHKTTLARMSHITLTWNIILKG